MTVESGYSITTTSYEEVANTTTAGLQSQATVTALADGGYLAVWQSGTDLAGRAYDADGTPRAAEFKIDLPNVIGDASLTTLSDGRVVVAFADEGAGLVRTRVYNPVTNSFGADLDSPTVGDAVDIAALANGRWGGVVVTEGSDQLWIQTRNANGDLNSSIIEDLGDGNTALDASVAGLKNGGFVVTWTQEPDDGGPSVIRAAAYNNSGFIMMGPITVSEGGEASDVQVIGLPDGGFAVAYTDTSWNDDGTEITLCMFDADGTRRMIGDEKPGYLFVNGAGSGDQHNPSLGVLANGTLVVTWEAGSDTFVQAISPTGELLGGASNWGWMTDSEVVVLANGDLAGVGDQPDGEITQLTAEVVRSTYGDDQADIFTGDLLVDIVEGRGGADTLRGGDGDDYLDGGAKGDFLQGGRGADTINGADGFDTASWIEADGVVINLIDEGDNAGGALGDIIAGIENFELSNGADVFRGDDYSHTVRGLKGHDLLHTGGSKDTLEGGDGNDTLIGGGGADSMVGGAGNDTYFVDNLGDVVVETAKGGVDRVVASVSFDTDGTNIEDMDANGDAAMNLAGNAQDNVLRGNSAANLLSGRDGDDRLDGGLGRDTLDGGAGRDTAWFWNTKAVTVTLANGKASSGGEVDQLISIEDVLGSFYDDAITGDDQANALDGDAGADTLAGGAGSDTLTGGDGVDTASYAGATAAVSVNLTTGKASGGDGADVLRGVESVIGSSYADTLTGTAGSNALHGGAGEDRLDGAAGDDLLDGGAGSDTAVYATARKGVKVDLSLTGAQDTKGGGVDTLVGVENLIGTAKGDVLGGDAGANVLSGLGGNDRLLGGDGNDVLDGGAGKDVLVGGLGADRLTGGADADLFVFGAVKDSSAKAPDLITDLQSEDVIDLRLIDANAAKAGDQAFTLVDAFTGKGGQAVLTYKAGADVTSLMLDVDGDKVADMTVQMSGDHADFGGFLL